MTSWRSPSNAEIHDVTNSGFERLHIISPQSGGRRASVPFWNLKHQKSEVSTTLSTVNQSKIPICAPTFDVVLHLDRPHLIAHRAVCQVMGSEGREQHHVSSGTVNVPNVHRASAGLLISNRGEGVIRMRFVLRLVIDHVSFLRGKRIMPVQPVHTMSQVRYGTFLRADDWLLVEGVHVTLFFSSHLLDPKQALINLTDTMISFKNPLSDFK